MYVSDFNLMEQLSAESRKNISEEELLELAKKELLRDVKCASVRAQQFGAHSWAKPQKYMPNKRFLRHMLVNASRDNYRADEKLKHNKSTRVTSAVSHQSHKHEHSSHTGKISETPQLQKHDPTIQKVKAIKRQSRWDASPKHSVVSLSHKSSDKEKKSRHHPAKIKNKRN